MHNVYITLMNFKYNFFNIFFINFKSFENIALLINTNI